MTDLPATPSGPGRPGVSIIVVTYNSSKTIATCLESLVQHTAPQDEVILVDNASRDTTLEHVEACAARHPGRIRVIRSERNLGFSRGNNRGLELAGKEYVVLLNPDVQVTAGWLDRTLIHLTGDPTVGAVGPTADYVAGLQKVDLYLDPRGFSTPDAISDALAQRRPGQVCETPLLIGFCLLCRRSLLTVGGGLDPDLFLGNDDLDLSLRLRQLGYKLLVALDVFVRHFGQVSFATEPSHKTRYLVQQSTNALYEKLYHLYGGEVPPPQELWGMSWFTPQRGLTSIIVLLHDNLAVTKQCIESVYAQTDREFEFLLVDNGSTEDAGSYAAELQRSCGNVRYIRNDENQGYAYGCNQGLAAAQGEFIVLLNNDVVVTRGWLGRQLALLSLDASIAMVGPRTNYSAGPQQVDGVTYQDMAGMHGYADQWFMAHAGEFTLVPRITGVCMVARREALEKVGGFDTGFGIGNFEDDDLCLRMVRAGYVLGIAHDVFVHHYGSATFRKLNVDYRRLMAENWRFFCHKWGHRGELRDGYPALDLARARAFAADRDHIPFRYADIFHPGAEPLRLEGARPVRFLCIPDWDDASWQTTVSTFLAAFTAADPVSLILRVEPPQVDLVENATSALTKLLSETGLPEDALPDIILETSQIQSRARGGLYAAATAFLPCTGSRAGLYVREARACGLTALADASPAALRAAAEALLAPAPATSGTA
ncbi:MAG: glycosyltransferase family 2 protein [Methanocella sp.]